ncbi:hypothetical protein [Mycobacterium sp. E802]|uniref:hypothetical protein n=1 Tax=Mycobacterium sp. E802 TaxID=1834152 RepID=UPI000A6AA9D1
MTTEDRSPPADLTLGFGTHICLGNQPARLELAATTRKLMERLPELAIATDDPLPLSRT